MSLENPYWLMSPVKFDYFFGRDTISMNAYLNNGDLDSESVDMSYGVRPVISLKNSNVVTSGTGSETDPWIIE